MHILKILSLEACFMITSPSADREEDEEEDEEELEA